MPLYLFQFAYTPDAWRTFVQNPEERGQAATALIEHLGGRPIGFYQCFGEYDGVALFEASDDKTAGAVAIAVFGLGSLRTMKTTKLFTMGESMEMLRKVGTITDQGNSWGD